MQIHVSSICYIQGPDTKFLILQNTDITCSPEEATLMLDDVEKLLVGPEKSAVEFYILSALSDLQQLLSQAANMKKSN